MLRDGASDAEIMLRDARAELALKDEALAVVVEDRDRQHAEIQMLCKLGEELAEEARGADGLALADAVDAWDSHMTDRFMRAIREAQ